MDRKSKNTLIVSIIALALVLVGVTYAYFSARITGLESASTLGLTAGRMGIHYSEGDENVSVSNIYPREEAWLTKTFTLTGWNTTNKAMKYSVYLNTITNTFPNNYLTYDLRLLESTNGSPIAEKINEPINGVGNIKLGTGLFNQADGEHHQYELKIYFKDNGQDQNDAQEAVFNGKINVSEYQPIDYQYAYNENNSETFTIPDSYTVNKSNCLASTSIASVIGSENLEQYCNGEEVFFYVDDDLVKTNIEQDLIYAYIGRFPLPLINDNIVEVISTKSVSVPRGNLTAGDYTYYPIALDKNGVSGWEVELTNKSSTAPITTEMYHTINGAPIINMEYLFSIAKSPSVDFASYDTSNVTNMAWMFNDSLLTDLDLSSFDTSNVADMSKMFMSSQAANINLSTFNTSNVVSMESMFYESNARILDLRHFDILKVTNMSKMFTASRAERIDISTFDLSGKNIEYIVSGVSGEIVLRSIDDLNLICNSGIDGENDMTFIINNEIVPTPANCYTARPAQ